MLPLLFRIAAALLPLLAIQLPGPAAAASSSNGIMSPDFAAFFLSDTTGISIQGQTLPGHIIFRVKPELAAYTKSDGIDHARFNKAMEAIGPHAIRKVFPTHLPPPQKTHPTGEELTDLSLIYEMQLGEEHNTEAAISMLLQTGMIEYAEPRYVPDLLYTLEDESPEAFFPDDSLLFTQYYLHNISAYEAWAVARGDTATFVAIVDTGNDFSHPDLMHAVRYNHGDPVNGEDSDNDGYIDNYYGWDLGEGRNFPQYHKHGHGVHVSGTSSATANNRIGIAGTGFDVRYMPVKVDDEHGRLVQAYEGIVYAADQGASVINCSWGGHFGGGRFGEDIVRYATLNRDALVVAGAGNASNSLPFYPASYEHVLGVAATDSLDHKWSVSSFGLFVGLTAPGVRMLSTWPGNRYIRSSGTSMSSPIVAGAAALVRSHFPELSAMQTAARLQATADLIDTIPENEDYAWLLGAGRLNMYRALTDPFLPYMRIAGHHLDEEGYGAFRPGDTMPVALNFQNLLAPANSITARLIPVSPHITMINDLSDLGAPQTLNTTSNKDNPFLVGLSVETPLNHTAPFFVEFYDHDSIQVGRQAFMVVVNKDYLTIDAGRIMTSITSKGAIGFNYPNYAQGAGLQVDRGFTQLKCAGLVLGEREDKVVDNIYGPEGSFFSASFTPVVNVARSPLPADADIETYGQFHDLEAGKNALGIDASHKTYFWEEAPRNRFFITEYVLTNPSDKLSRLLHAGFFVDWASRNSIDMLARFDHDLNMAYVNINQQDQFAGLQMLTELPARHYAFDNDGHNGSIQINNGFETADKYLALTTTRAEAGSSRPENDVSSMLSTGPHLLLPGQSLRVAFALHNANSYQQLAENATLAAATYQQITTGHPVYTSEATLASPAAIHAYPNPFGSRLVVELTRPSVNDANIYIFNNMGELVTKILQTTGPDANWQQAIDTSQLPPGIYHLVVEQDGNRFPLRLLKYE